ncbi:MAG: Nif3-like dinuclear metal center hexameric protein [Alloprevotella sp.]|nr:Nif3-like dinuclear metal center hexameric protein [Alloprevotella sp.]MBR1653249.1 Nif3-like dinuclear metal center hexameric protein [Alloprevotella sp.]
MKIKEVAEALERFAPLPLQESYDNAGLQIGLTEADNLTGVLLCLDVTEDVIREAARKGCNLVVSHHPLLFRGLKCIADETMVQRCVRLAIREGVAVYSAHTNLDNAEGGVNWMIAERLGAEPIGPLNDKGEGLLCRLPEALPAEDFLRHVKDAFRVEKLCTNVRPDAPRKVTDVALCGGAGDFLLDDALRLGADAFLTGEMHYHQYFGLEDRIVIGVLGHYESEQFTVQLLHRILSRAFPALRIEETDVNTNPIRYL